MTRADLLALTDDTLAALANRGLVKRATKEVATSPPSIAATADGTVTATFADGVTTTLPAAGRLDAATCTCAATGVCRHVLATVLAYQRAAPEETAAEPLVSPGTVSDERLTELFGARTVAEANRRGGGAGLSAVVRRGTPDAPVTVVELPTATVRFLVPGDPSYADCDARAGERDLLIVLAVWACRRADEQDADASVVRVAIAGARTTSASTVDTVDTVAARAALDAVCQTLVDLLWDGVVGIGPVWTAALRRARDECDRHNLRWPVAALDELAEQLDAYTDRAAAHDPLRVAELITELHARRAATLPPAVVWGTEEAEETPLRQVRLIALGARVGRVAVPSADGAAVADEIDTAEVFLAHPDAEMVLAVQHSWPRTSAGTGVAARRVAGASLGALAAGNVVSENAVRSAGRVVRFSAGRLAKTAVTPVGAGWDRLPPSLRPPSLSSLREELDALPPRPVRPRIAAELVRVLPVAEVRDVRYLAGAQRLDAVIADADGTEATVSLTQRRATPTALDTLAAALADDPSEVSGQVHRGRGGLVIEPYAVRTAHGVIVPDLAVGDSDRPLPPATTSAAPDGLTQAVTATLGLLAEAAHRGIRHLPTTFADRVTTAANTLATLGLTHCADAMRAVHPGAAPVDAPTAWLAAHLRLRTAAELR